MVYSFLGTIKCKSYSVFFFGSVYAKLKSKYRLSLKNEHNLHFYLIGHLSNDIHLWLKNTLNMFVVGDLCTIHGNLSLLYSLFLSVYVCICVKICAMRDSHWQFFDLYNDVRIQWLLLHGFSSNDVYTFMLVCVIFLMSPMYIFGNGYGTSIISQH